MSGRGRILPRGHARAAAERQGSATGGRCTFRGEGARPVVSTRRTFSACVREALGSANETDACVPRCTPSDGCGPSTRASRSACRTRLPALAVKRCTCSVMEARARLWTRVGLMTSGRRARCHGRKRPYVDANEAAEELFAIARAEPSASALARSPIPTRGLRTPAALWRTLAATGIPQPGCRVAARRCQRPRGVRDDQRRRRRRPDTSRTFGRSGRSRRRLQLGIGIFDGRPQASTVVAPAVSRHVRSARRFWATASA